MRTPAPAVLAVALVLALPAGAAPSSATLAGTLWAASVHEVRQLEWEPDGAGGGENVERAYRFAMLYLSCDGAETFVAVVDPRLIDRAAALPIGETVRLRASWGRAPLPQNFTINPAPRVDFVASKIL